MKESLAAAVALTILALSPPHSMGQTSALDRLCLGKQGALPDERIRACTSIVHATQMHLARAFNDRGTAYGLNGEFERAIQDYDQAIRLNPQDAVFFNSRCLGRALASKLDAALADCNESLRLHPYHADILDSRGLVYLKLNRLADAIADYDAALRLDAKHAYALYGRGIAKQKKGDTAGATVDMAAAKAIQPDIEEKFRSYGVR